MPTRNLTIINRLGLHARAAAKFVERAQAFEATINVGIRTAEQLGAVAQQHPHTGSDPGQPINWVDGKSIMSVMLLAAGRGTEIQLRAEGQDAIQALDAIGELVTNRFGEAE